MFLTEVRRHNDEDLHAWAKSLLTDLKNAGTTFTAHYIGYGQWTFGDENEWKDNRITVENLFAKAGTTCSLSSFESFFLPNLLKSFNLKICTANP